MNAFGCLFQFLMKTLILTLTWLTLLRCFFVHVKKMGVSVMISAVNHNVRNFVMLYNII